MLIKIRNSFSPGQGRGGRKNKELEKVGQWSIPCLNRHPQGVTLRIVIHFKIINAKVINGQIQQLTVGQFFEKD